MAVGNEVRLAWPAGLLLLVACGSTEPAKAYADAAALALVDPLAAAAACERVAVDQRDECLSFTARSAAKSDPDLAGTLCARAGPSLWRDECWFLVAEASVQVHGGETAARGCANAGRYSANCLDHVWRAHAASLLAGSDPATAAARYASARSWSTGVIAEDPDLDGHFWRKFYDAPLHYSELPTLDAAWCDTMAGEVATICHGMLVPAFRHTLVRIDRERQTQGRPIDRAVLCNLESDDATRIAGALGVTYVAGGALDEVAARFVASRCGWMQPSMESKDAGDHPGGVR